MQSPYLVREKIWEVVRPFIPNVKTIRQLPIGNIVVACTPHLGEVDASVSIQIETQVIDEIASCGDRSRELAILRNIKRIVSDCIPPLMSARLGYNSFVIKIGREALAV